MATLPNAVQRQIDAANQLLTEANRPAETTQPPAQVQPDQTQEPTAQVVEQVTEASPAPAPQPPRDEWHQKYQILQGKYNAEVPQLHHQVKDLTRRLNETVDRMEQLSKVKETEQQQAQTSLDPKDVENFGSDLVDMVQRVAQKMLGGVAAKVEGIAGDLERRVAQLEQALKGTTQAVTTTAEELFFNKLTAQVPDWEQVNSDERFLGWLAEVDPMLGQPRQAALDAAQANLNVARAVAIFNAFKATLPQSPKAKPVGKQVSPSAVASAAPVSQEKPVFTQQQIVDFYNAKRRGEYRGREQDAAQAEQMINLAIAEGRVH